MSEKTFVVNDSFFPNSLTDANWENGILRTTGSTILLKKQDFLQLWLNEGNVLEFPVSGRRRVTSISFAEPYAHVTIEGKPITAEDATGPIKIIRPP